MPFTAKQRRLFFAAAGSKSIAAKHGISQHEAGKLAKEAASMPVKKPKRKTILAR